MFFVAEFANGQVDPLRLHAGSRSRGFHAFHRLRHHFQSYIIAQQNTNFQHCYLLIIVVATVLTENAKPVPHQRHFHEGRADKGACVVLPWIERLTRKDR